MKPTNWAKENPERMDFLRKRWLENNKEYRKQYIKNYNRQRKLKSYGLTTESFDKLFKSQDYKCAICLTDTPTKKGWCIDHCHSTGQVRGIVCDYCNLMLGYAKDNTTTIRNAITYLEKTK